jgi:RNA polymerase sigma factor (TIGR02999 family)
VNEQQDITRLLSRWSDGDEEAMAALTPLVYEHLHRLARSAFRQEGQAQTLQATAVLNEAWLQLAGSKPAVENRAHFYALAARMMRRILVNHAEARNAQKRGGGLVKLTLEEGRLAGPSTSPDVLALHEALAALAEHDPQLERVLELHYFGGHTYREIGEALQVSESTAKRQLRFARAWVRRHLREAD